MLPKIDGLEVCRRLRSRSSVPIIMLTAKSEEIDKVVGLELGADDYITKPFSIREFSSRIKAALRRAEMSRPDETGARRGARSRCASCGSTSPSAPCACAATRPQLTFVEFEILAALARSPGRVFTRDMLLARIWGDSAYRDPRTIDVHIRHLREKIERDPKEPEYLFTVRGVGYRFRDTDSLSCRQDAHLAPQPPRAGVLRDHAACDRGALQSTSRPVCRTGSCARGVPSSPTRRSATRGGSPRRSGSADPLARGQGAGRRARPSTHGSRVTLLSVATAVSPDGPAALTAGRLEHVGAGSAPRRSAPAVARDRRVAQLVTGTESTPTGTVAEAAYPVVYQGQVVRGGRVLRRRSPTSCAQCR